jgi:hypothetical protein
VGIGSFVIVRLILCGNIEVSWTYLEPGLIRAPVKEAEIHVFESEVWYLFQC